MGKEINCRRERRKNIYQKGLRVVEERVLTEAYIYFLVVPHCMHDSSAGKESACNAGDPRFNSWVRKICYRRDRLPTPVFLGFPGGSVGKESACNVGDLGSIPRLGRTPGEGKEYPLQYSGLENSMYSIDYGIAKSQT